ncbi:DUF1853 family protein [Gramella jeungdoensis]|uniref:DUF1853 family protein n=1 Tax=Gramella jeungdoensis TaxID=708091 RepID=A0ABT0Z2M0_9FLAO|nr:DUF1853 family protein [Gramella jeungdoensis]MCM8569988.1 DUF1853 family protein [Gramella jeungdoensis]
MHLKAQFTGFCSTPSILPKDRITDFPSFDFPDVQVTERLQNDLEKIEHPRNSVLGKRMESFFKLAIKHSERYRLIDSNIQIVHNKQTLGELDFLVYDELKIKPLHVELVYKLYIYDEQLSPGINRWIGPNRRDSFSQKLDKLNTRQFPILYKPETGIYLKELGIKPEGIEQQLCFKAKLFTPNELQLTKASEINPECHEGEWYRFSEFLNFEWEENLFFSPPKRFWSAVPESNKEWFSHSEIIKTIEAFFEKQKSPLIWMKTKTGYKSFFVVWW